MATAAPPAPATAVADRLRQIVGRDAVITAPSELIVYECDAFTIEKNRPFLVAFPSSRLLNSG